MSAIRAEVIVGDRNPIAGAGGDLPLTQTPEGRLRVDAALSVADVEITVTEYTEDAAAAANPIGPVMLAVRRDTLVTNEVSANGDNVALKATDKGELYTAPNATALSGGIPSTARLLSAAGSAGDATNVKASAGRVYAIQGYNASASVRFLKLYNSASAPTAGAGTPVKTLALPPLAAFAFDWPLGLTFATGIGFALVTTGPDNGSTSVTAADIVGLNIDYA